MNSSEKNIAVIAVSGGLDSCVTAAIAKQEFELAFAHFNYGQRTEKRELKAFNDLADFLNVEKQLVIDISHLSEIGGSSLTDKKIEVSPADLSSKEIPTSYVPFRNANILAACVSWAEVLKAKGLCRKILQVTLIAELISFLHLKKWFSLEQNHQQV